MATVVKKSSPAVLLLAFSRSGRPVNHAFGHQWLEPASTDRPPDWAFRLPTP